MNCSTFGLVHSADKCILKTERKSLNIVIKHVCIGSYPYVYTTVVQEVYNRDRCPTSRQLWKLNFKYKTCDISTDTFIHTLWLSTIWHTIDIKVNYKNYEKEYSGDLL